MAEPQAGLTVDQYYDKFKQALESNDPNAVSFANEVGEKYGKLGRRATRQEFVGLMLDRGIIDAPSDLPKDKVSGVLQGLQGTEKTAPKENTKPGPPESPGVMSKPLVDYIPGARKGGEWLAGALAVPPAIQKAAEKLPGKGGVEGTVKGYVGFQKGVAEGFADAGMDMTSPKNLALAAGTFLTGKATRAVKLVNLVRKMAGGVFTVQALADLAKEAPEAYELFQKGDYEGAGKAAAKSATDVLIGYESAKAVKSGTKAPAAKELAPAPEPVKEAAPAAPDPTRHTAADIPALVAEGKAAAARGDHSAAADAWGLAKRLGWKGGPTTAPPPEPVRGEVPGTGEAQRKARAAAAAQRAKTADPTASWRRGWEGLGVRIAPEETGELPTQKPPTSKPITATPQPASAPLEPVVPDGTQPGAGGGTAEHHYTVEQALPGMPKGSIIVPKESMGKAKGPNGETISTGPTVVEVIHPNGTKTQVTIPVRESVSDMVAKGWIKAHTPAAPPPEPVKAETPAPAKAPEPPGPPPAPPTPLPAEPKPTPPAEASPTETPAMQFQHGTRVQHRGGWTGTISGVGKRLAGREFYRVIPDTPDEDFREFTVAAGDITEAKAGTKPATSNVGLSEVPADVTKQVGDITKTINASRGGGESWKRVAVQPLSADRKTTIGPPIELDVEDFNPENLWAELSKLKGVGWIKMSDPDFGAKSGTIIRPLSLPAAAPPEPVR